jgi:putative phosphoesterase
MSTPRSLVAILPLVPRGDNVSRLPTKREASTTWGRFVHESCSLQHLMKIGIISDIHATPQALRRALEHMPSTDLLLCPGDAISEYRFCPDTVELLRQAGTLCIQGNHEVVLFSGHNPAYLKKCQATFATDTLDFLATAPISRDLICDGLRILLVHGSPWDPYDEYIYPHSMTLTRFATLAYDIVCCGHTHVPFVYQAGHVMVINPGSCSQPRDQDRRGAYAIFDTATKEARIYRFSLG